MVDNNFEEHLNLRNIVDDFNELMEKDMQHLMNDSSEESQNEFVILNSHENRDIIKEVQPSRRRRKPFKSKSLSLLGRRNQEKASHRSNNVHVKSPIVIEDDSKDESDNVGVRKRARTRGKTLSKRKSTNASYKARSKKSKPCTVTDTIVVDDSDGNDGVAYVINKNVPDIKSNSEIIDYPDYNQPVNVKVSWMCEGMIFKLRPFEPFEKVFEAIAKEKNIAVDSITLTKGGVTVKPDDTPDGINLSILDILSGCILKQRISKSERNKDILEKNRDILSINIIRENKRDKNIGTTIRRHQKMRVLFVKIAEILKCDLNTIQLWFDGEKVNQESVTDDLELEGDECFELKLLTKKSS